ncbi:MAG: hypothetical protein IT262_21580 [Saprospiraceae bacterium]|nr:hypothetical protein [Saprospiraceae bacterium]
MKKFRKMFLLTAVLFVCCCLVSCADAEPVKTCLTGRNYGLIFGLIHGFITPLSFIASLFNDNVAIYGLNNSGGLYDLGFLLGSSGWGFLAGNRSRK